MATPGSEDKKDIVIIGGGIIGSTTAYYLTRHPSYNPEKHTITVLEATSIASGASGKAGGLLAKWAYPSALVPLSYRLHAELAAEHGGAEKWGYREVGCGSIELRGRDEKALDAANATQGVSLEKQFGGPKKGKKVRGLPADLDWVLPELVQGYEAMAGPGETAQVHPYQFTTTIMSLAEEKGAKVVFGQAKNILREDVATGVSYVEKDSGEVKTLPATDIVVTAGPWTSRVIPGAPIVGQRAHSITVRPAGPISAYCLFTEISLPGGTRAAPEIYARPNDEVYICGEGDSEVKLPETSADVEVDVARCDALVTYTGSVSEELRKGEVTAKQACYLPIVSAGGGPLVGETGWKGVWMAAGHTCWGINNGPATGKVMSEFVFDGMAKSANVKSLDPRKHL